MGQGDSKICPLSYEDATARLRQEELKRIDAAFRRAVGLRSLMPKAAFVRDVLGDSFPTQLADEIYWAFGGGSKGIGHKDLVAGLTFLIRGGQEEKVKFLFTLLSDGGEVVYQTDLERMITLADGARALPVSLRRIFASNDWIKYRDFRSWTLSNYRSFSLAYWLLDCPNMQMSDGTDATPSYYKTLGTVSGLKDTEVERIDRRYYGLKITSRTGKMDRNVFSLAIVGSVPEELHDGLFAAFDGNGDGYVDVKDMCCSIAQCCRKSLSERLKFAFRVFDVDADGWLSRSELTNMISICITLRRRTTKEETDPTTEQSSIDEALKELLETSRCDEEKGLNLEEYLKWAETNSHMRDFLNYMNQVCHLVFGLKPKSKREEGNIVLNWVESWKNVKRKPGDIVYLITAAWWKTWKNRVTVIPAVTPSASTPPASPTTPTSRSNGSATSPSSPLLPSLPTLNTSATTAATSATTTATTTTTTATTTATANGNSISSSPRKQKRSTALRLGPIDNSVLCEPDTRKSVILLTSEGAYLKKHVVLVEGSHFELLPEPVWQSLAEWYGARFSLPRQIILEGERTAIELYPIPLKLYKHSTQAMKSASSWGGVGLGFFFPGGGSGGNSAAGPSVQQPRRVLGYSAAFSKKMTIKQMYAYIQTRLKIKPEDLRLWDMKPENNLELWDDEDERTLEEMKIEENHKILVEMRNRDLSWPEELLSLTGKKGKERKRSTNSRTEISGTTGLSNLGNTCFMNSALQCLSNTKLLTDYFLRDLYLYDLNRDNPLGLQGKIAKRYGDLVTDLWKGDASSVAPLKMRWTIGKYAPRFNGYQQHDSQELLAFLLDGLHEDLNRVQEKPYVELKDSNGRPDSLVAAEAWDNHLKRNKSVVVDLFQGQLRSEVVCKVCGYESVRFDPFSFLSLPLPMENLMYTEVPVIRRDGSVPFKYGLRLSTTETYENLKSALAKLSGVDESALLIAEITNGAIRNVPKDSQKIKMGANYLYAYEIPDVVDEEEEEETTVVVKEEIEDVGEVETQTDDGDETAGDDPTEEDSSLAPLTNNDDGGKEKSTDWTEVTDHPLSPTRTQAESSVDDDKEETSPSPSSMSMTCSYLVAVNRKMTPVDCYFLPHQKNRPYPFGLPVIVNWKPGTKQRDLYDDVKKQIERFLSPKEIKAEDKEIYNEYPFVLKTVTREGTVCSKCPWHRFCRGCTIDCTDDVYRPVSCYLAIDWNTMDYYLRYQFSQERSMQDHSSIEQNRQQDIQPIDLDQCFEAFTKEEELGEEESWYCSKCKKHQTATKKMNIWKLPPVLIIHLKRFQIVNGRWVKSHKAVKFLKNDFDPSRYVFVPQAAAGAGESAGSSSAPAVVEVLQSPSLQREKPPLAEEGGGNEEETIDEKQDSKATPEDDPDAPNDFEILDRPTTATSDANGEESRIGHRYNLYAVCVHSGIMGGGHYVTYAKNHKADKWYIFNDSSCKEIDESRVDAESPYLLFYERQGFEFKFEPEGRNKVDISRDDDDDYNSDVRRWCVIQ
ncbi:ubiquitin carboxyl-terminal hydrolase 32-like isoform X2 [Oscarella lobularis]|uniref:ubiquitin carboxyl-terminal hydrolase 32-like isoform X2 n=1 Tax=Oscarella lobularis TaxID=121494 RepID=UPI0033136F0D